MSAIGGNCAGQGLIGAVTLSLGIGTRCQWHYLDGATGGTGDGGFYAGLAVRTRTADRGRCCGGRRGEAIV